MKTYYYPEESPYSEQEGDRYRREFEVIETAVEKTFPNFQAFQVVLEKNKKVHNMKKVKRIKQNLRIDELWKKHTSIFWPSCAIACRQCGLWGTKSTSKNDGKPPHRPLYQLSSAELEAAQKYFEHLFKEGEFEGVF